MCGPHSALGLEETERLVWPLLRERLREPGRMMALMRGVLGGDTEVAAVTSVTPAGIVQPLAILATPAIADEITLGPERPGPGLRRGRIADDEVDVIVDDTDDHPIAVIVNAWIFHNLTLYTRKLWSRRPPR